MKLGLIGAGRIGQIHAENLTQRIPNAALITVCDAIPDVAAQCAERFHIPHQRNRFEDILADPEVDGVVVCSPTDTHTLIIEEAARAGKHVFCEKPIDFDIDRIDRALKAVEDAGILLHVGFNRRFDTSVQRIHRAIAEGTIGVPHQLHIVSRDPAPPTIDYVERSGGIFLDMAIHDFDLSRFLINSEVQEIYATGSVCIDQRIGDVGDFDTATTLLKFANGVVGTIQNSRRAVYGYDQRVEVFGSKGSISMDNLFANSALVRASEFFYRDPPLNFFLERYKESYLEEMIQFVTAVHTRKPSPFPGVEARVPVVMGLAALKSCRENRPVSIREISSRNLNSNN